jgi:arabinoxylan arabinofuranohydrolase
MTTHLFSGKTSSVCTSIIFLSSCIYAANPIITSTYTADPSPHQWSDGKYYMYCSHDKDEDVDWNMEDYHVFSSTDLVNWVDNGIAFRKTDSPFGNGAALWAPDCMYRNGLYYLYYPQNSVIGVATSTSPTGPFANARKLYQTANSQYSYDPMIFVDDDNQAYLLVSSCMKPDGAFKPVLCKLGSDMTSITQETILSTTGNFHEGPWLFKRSGIYYLTWGGGECHYSTSTTLTGPYTYKGVICNQWRDASGTLITGNQQHPGIACFSGQWYFASAWGAPDNKRRRIFMEYLYFNADGTIKFITPDMKGVVAPPTSLSTAAPTPAQGKASSGSAGRIVFAPFNSGAAMNMNAALSTSIAVPPSVPLYTVSGKRLFPGSRAPAAGKGAAGAYVYRTNGPFIQR